MSSSSRARPSRVGNSGLTPFPPFPLSLHGECAVEVFAQDARRCTTFIGVRFDAIAHDDAERFIHEVAAVALGTDVPLSRVARWLSVRLGASLFETCTVIEVGVIDAWRSLGSVPVAPRVGGHGSTTAAHAALLAAAKQIAAPAGSVIAVELASSAPLAHWVGVEIARSTDGDAAVASASARKAATLLTRLAAARKT